MNSDFRPSIQPPTEPPRRRRRLLWLLPLLVLGVGLAFLNYLPLPPTESEPPPAPAAPPEIRQTVIEGSVKPGETMSSLLDGYVTPQEILALAARSRPVFPFSKLCAGQPYRICVQGGELDRFEYEIDLDSRLIIQRNGEDFDISRLPIPYTVNTELVQGSIRSSLFEAVNEAGETDALAVMLADIFAYDIDFIRDLRTEDSFRVLVEKRFREGEPAGYGRILAAVFNNQGEAYTAFLFKDGSNPPTYYNAEGKALRKAFLKAPLAFSRISSGFTMRRFHPITKTWKAHPAIDYAAPAGTPIMAIGDGSVINIGRTAGNGNFIKLRHTNGIESMYLHMSRFAKGMSKGKRVLQGQTIGFVGSTGLATGPHLCFRMFQSGAPLNPAKLKSTTTAPVSRERLAEFRETIAPLQQRLKGEGMLQASLETQRPARP